MVTSSIRSSRYTAFEEIAAKLTPIKTSGQLNDPFTHHEVLIQSLRLSLKPDGSCTIRLELAGKCRCFPPNRRASFQSIGSVLESLSYIFFLYRPPKKSLVFHVGLDGSSVMSQPHRNAN